MGEVIGMNGKAPIQGIKPKDVLKSAAGENLANVFVIGEMPDGTVYLNTSIADAPLAGWLLDIAKATVIKDSIG